jgi:hypothetical protein
VRRQSLVQSNFTIFNGIDSLVIFEKTQRERYLKLKENIIQEDKEIIKSIE